MFDNRFLLVVASRVGAETNIPFPPGSFACDVKGHFRFIWLASQKVEIG